MEDTTILRIKTIILIKWTTIPKINIIKIINRINNMIKHNNIHTNSSNIIHPSNIRNNNINNSNINIRNSIKGISSSSSKVVWCRIIYSRMDKLSIHNNRVVLMLIQMNNQITTPKEIMLLSLHNSKVNRYYNQMKINKFIKILRHIIKLLKQNHKYINRNKMKKIVLYAMVSKTVN